jgi:hypothetical protein
LINETFLFHNGAQVGFTSLSQNPRFTSCNNDNNNGMKQATISVQLHLPPQSEITSMEVQLNGTVLPMKSHPANSRWQGSKTIAGPLGFALRATGSGTLFLLLKCGKQTIVKKSTAFENEKIELNINEIPLLT